MSITVEKVSNARDEVGTLLSNDKKLIWSSQNELAILIPFKYTFTIIYPVRISSYYNNPFTFIKPNSFFLRKTNRKYSLFSLFQKLLV